MLLSAIGNAEFDKWINGIVLSVKERDVLTQIWLSSNRPRQKQKVQELASQALQEHCPLLFTGQTEGLCGSRRGAVEWRWRAHPTALTSTKEQLKPLKMGEKRDASKPMGDVDDLPAPGHQGDTSEERGSCGECLGGATALRGGCAIA